MRLSRENIGHLPGDVAHPTYDVATQKCGIVHFGIGAFHRAHQAVYTDSAMNAGDTDWRITGVSLRSASVHDQLTPQDGLYTVTSKSAGEPQTRLIGSIAGVLVAPQSAEAVIAAVASPATKIVTFTITEKGYHRAADGTLDFKAAAIADELADDAPATAYGFLARALAHRKAADLPGLTLLSCDNFAENGRKLESLLIAYLNRCDPALADWTAKTCTFPCSMVDRIVPATTKKDLEATEKLLGMRDEGAVFTEPFSQWVIEDRFAGPRPRWEDSGAQIVSDVAPYETAKLRMLNGAHSALAYLGLAKGLEVVSEAIGDAEIAPLVGSLMREEAATSFTPSEGQDLRGYAADLERRFANPALPHRLAQIAMDGSQKIPQRWLETLSYHQKHGRTCPALLDALSAWIVYVRGDDHTVEDPMAAALASAWEEHGKDGIVAALFGECGVFASHYIADSEAMNTLNARVNTRMQSADPRV